MAEQRNPSVFLSYARADDEAFVRRLHYALTENGFDAWWDRVSMPSRSLTFQQEIRDAIEGHDRVILILGPQAVASDYVRAEWQYALAADKIVSPVLRVGTYALMPAELKSLHCTDGTASRAENDALAEILRIARDPAPPIGRAFHVPAPPPHFQPRLDEFTRLASHLVIGDAERLAMPSPRRALVLQGMGGLGKSVLAAAVAKAAATRRIFSDGVLWLRFGAETTSVLPQLQEAGRALGDDIGQYDSDARGRATRAAS